jgi:lysophospholipase L1-like esterase
MTPPVSTPPQGAAVFQPPTHSAEDANFFDVGRRFGNRRSLFFLAALFVICVAAAVDWFTATTSRLYVDEDSIASRQEGTVWEHFGIRGNEVMPEIISRDEARFVFPVSLATPHWLLFSARPEGDAEYKIILRNGAGSQEIAAQKINGNVSKKISLPAGEGELEFVVHGRIAWFDPRLVRRFFLWPVYLGAVIALLIAFRNRPAPPATRASIGNWLALIASTVVCLGLIEFVLRRVALKLPPAVLSARHDLGLRANDTRWIDSPRYKQRLRPNLNTICEWRYGDIVRMGFIPPELSEGAEHRYPFQTDAEGFRNSAVRPKIDIAALGDSFTDAMTSPVEEGWPARLEKITGQKVQNYGTSAFGPQQELYVLEDYAIQHQPGHVVLAFFAGNDLFDAEHFETWAKGEEKPGEETTGWRLQKRFHRYESLFLTTLVRVALSAPAPRKNPTPATDRTDSKARFDRGIYEIPIPGAGPLRFAVMPAYLQKLGTPRQEFERTRGWELVRATLLRMKETCERAGSRLTVMFIPSKAEAYWPLIERSLGPDELQRAIDFSCSYNHMHLRAAEIQANRLAQNDLLRDFCAATKIQFLDLTPALEQNAAVGRAVYFADDAHWNAAGHELAAQELAKFLAFRP